MGSNAVPSSRSWLRPGGFIVGIMTYCAQELEMTELLWMSENVSCPGAEWNFVEFGMLLLILCWEGLFSVFANFRGEISLFLISKVFSLLDAVIIFSKSSGDIYQNLLEIRAPLIYLTLPWYSSFIHPYKAKKHMFPDFSTHKVATGINSLWLGTFWIFTIGKCFLSSIVVQVIL